MLDPKKTSYQWLVVLVSEDLGLGQQDSGPRLEQLVGDGHLVLGGNLVTWTHGFELRVDGDSVRHVEKLGQPGLHEVVRQLALGRLVWQAHAIWM